MSAATGAKAQAIEPVSQSVGRAGRQAGESRGREDDGSFFSRILPGSGHPVRGGFCALHSSLQSHRDRRRQRGISHCFHPSLWRKNSCINNRLAFPVFRCFCSYSAAVSAGAVPDPGVGAATLSDCSLKDRRTNERTNEPTSGGGRKRTDDVDDAL